MSLACPECAAGASHARLLLTACRCVPIEAPLFPQAKRVAEARATLAAARAIGDQCVIPAPRLRGAQASHASHMLTACRDGITQAEANVTAEGDALKAQVRISCAAHASRARSACAARANLVTAQGVQLRAPRHARRHPVASQAQGQRRACEQQRGPA